MLDEMKNYYSKKLLEQIKNTTPEEEEAMLDNIDELCSGPIKHMARKVAEAIDEHYNELLKPYGIHIDKNNASEYVGRLEIKQSDFDSFGRPHKETICLDGKELLNQKIEYETKMVEEDNSIKCITYVKRELQM